MWVMDDENDKMELREISFVPGLYKIFDEIMGNAFHFYDDSYYTIFFFTDHIDLTVYKFASSGIGHKSLRSLVISVASRIQG